MTKTAIYAGSFDPIHFGHLEIVKRGGEVFDHVVISVGNNPSKAYLFSLEDRLEMIREATGDWPGVEVEPFSGLLVDHVRRRGCRHVLRGLRSAADFESERQMAFANREMEPSLETVFLLADPRRCHLSSTLLREIASLGGDVSRHVPPSVARRLAERFGA